MSKTDIDTRAQIISCLAEGLGVRPSARACGVSVNAVQRLIRSVGAACLRFHDEQVRGLLCAKIEADEQWAFCYARAKNVPEEFRGQTGYGDVWLWTTICATSKIVPAWYVGDRDTRSACRVYSDLGKRLANERVEINSDGFNGHWVGVEMLMLQDHQVDYARIIKKFKTPNGEWNSRENRYAQPAVVGVKREAVCGQPDVERASTSYCERLNLGTRQHCRKMARLTNGHAKKLEMLRFTLAIHFTAYNWCKKHESLDGRTPAMANGLATRRLTTLDLAQLPETYRLAETA